MPGVYTKGATSKQKHRKAARRKSLRDNAAAKRAAKKAGQLKHAGKSRDKRAKPVSSKSTEELVNDVNSGAVHATFEVTDARALADMLKVAAKKPQEGATAAVGAGGDKVTEGRKWMLSDERIAETIPKDEKFEKLNAELDEEDARGFDTNERKNPNHYARRGPALAFWKRMDMHPLLLSALKELHFTHPTPIQQESLPSTMCLRRDVQDNVFRPQDCNKDYVISAETGSGKTLAFALPILQRVLVERGSLIDNIARARAMAAEAQAEAAAAAAEEAEEEEDEAAADAEEGEEGAEDADAEEGDEEEDEESIPDGEEMEEGEEYDEEYDDDEVDPLSDAAIGAIKVLHSLVLTPTRELALQIQDCMKKLTVNCRDVVRIGCVVGGMAPAKQQRILNRCPDVLICTPGRLWDLVKKNEGAFLGHSISRRLSCVVLDEADRLIESGKFEELKAILERIRCDVLPQGREDTQAMTEGVWDDEKKEFIPTAKAKTGRKDEPRMMPMPPPPPEGHRTSFFVTSATLSLQVNFQNKNKKEKKILRTKNANTMKLVMGDLGLHEKTSRIFDLAPDANVVAKLQETYMRCPAGTKELYLFYFLRQYSKDGRVIVFVNAISMLRRLVKILELLHIPAVGLHASMQQRQRLKVIDKFRAGTKPVLIATDVAARGLDVEGVRFVVHYQLARSTDAYIHRCGRTARCGGEGFSCVFVHPDEFNPYKQLMQSMGRSAKLEVLSVDETIVHRLRPLWKMALDVDLLSRSVRKTNASQGWVSRMAKDAELDADDMIDGEAGQEMREKAKAAKNLQRRLDAMLRDSASTQRGAYLSAPRALGAKEAVKGLHERAERQLKAHRKEKR